MRAGRYFIFMALLVASWPCVGQSHDWLPVSQHDLQIQEAPGAPGAPAIQLYYADYAEDIYVRVEFVYHRIKILNEKGNKYADIEILTPPFASVKELKARTIHPDGKIVDFSGKVFEKTVVKGRGYKFAAKAFTLPDVTPGSIIEYKYVIEQPFGYIHSWTLQHDLYTFKQSFLWKPASGSLPWFSHGYRVASVYAHMPQGLRAEMKGDAYRLEVENMPAFDAESLMPPEDDLKAQVKFFYTDRDVVTPEKFWTETGRSWHYGIELFIGNHKEIKEAALQAIGSETDPEKKLRKLYARAQQVRNLSFERERTEQEQKQEQIKDSQEVTDVLKRGYGTHGDITLFFVALARAGGFDSYLLPVGSRKSRFFDKLVLDQRQLEVFLAVVRLGDKELFLDPGTEFCPFGLVRWMNTSTVGLKLEKNGGSLITVPPATQDKAILTRTADLSLGTDGALKGAVTVQYSGYDALEHRLDALDTDEAGRTKDLEEEVKGWLPPGATVKLVSSQDWTEEEAPLVAKFTIQVPNFASVAGKRLLVPSYLFQGPQLDAFKHSERKYPVYFPYAFAEVDNLQITVPDEYVAESVPQPQEAALPYAKYQSLFKFDGNKLSGRRVLLMNGIYFPMQRYMELKGFYNSVQTGDEQPTVLRPHAASGDPKGN